MENWCQSIEMGVSENSGTPKHPKMIIFSRKTHGCWVPLFSETSKSYREESIFDPFPPKIDQKSLWEQCCTHHSSAAGLGSQKIPGDQSAAANSSDPTAEGHPKMVFQ